MSVQWHATGTGQRVAAPSVDPVAAERTVLEDGDDVAGSLRCLVYYVLPAAALGAIGFFAGLAWLALKLLGG